LEVALADVGRPWTSGPLAEPSRALLAARAEELAERLAEHDAVAAGVLQTRSRWVVTHGEPHGGNVIHDPAGDLHLIDWDTAMIAPRERPADGARRRPDRLGRIPRHRRPGRARLRG